MARWTVAHRYRSSRDGQAYGPWMPGDVVDLDDDVAEWVNRDSPGCLQAEQPEVAERAKPPGRDRQHRGGTNRGRS